MAATREKILVFDRVSPKGVEILRRYPEFEVEVIERRCPEEELVSLVQEATAIIVRSETKITRRVLESAPKLKIVGRAGVGVDNIDVETATKQGVVVVNAPGGNTISTAELTIAMMMSLARKIPMAHASMKAGEWNRKAFKGIELRGKTLGILGLGRIGSEVAKRAVALGMRVLAYDPYLSRQRAKALQVELLDSLDHLLEQVDFLTIHLPKSPETIGLIDAKAMSKMKRGAYIINCARGGIVVEKDLIEAIRSGQIAGAALDVYETEPLPSDSPLRSIPQIVMTPHLGASTVEAQDSVGIEIAEVVAEYLLYGTIRNSVNIPGLDAKTRELVEPYLHLGEKLGKILAQLAPPRVDRLILTYGGRVKEVPEDPITRSILIGYLRTKPGMEANFVNARTQAEQLGLLVEEVKSSEEIDYHEWIHAAAEGEGTRVSVAGTLFSARHLPRIVRLNDQPVEIVPEGVLLFLNNADRPGMVGHIGTILGKHGVNIANMSLHRDRAGGKALTVLNLDHTPPPAAIEELIHDPDISNVCLVKL